MIDDDWPLSDERLQFYLRHRRRIEEWAALGVEVRRATLDAFLSLGPEFEGLAAELGADVRLDDADSDFPRWSFRRDFWPLADNQHLVAIAVEGERRTLVAESTSAAPSVGICLHEPDGRGAPLRQALSGVGRDPDVQGLGYRPGRSRFWPAYRRVAAEGEWWATRAAWSDALSAGVREAWALLGPRVDEALNVTAVEARQSDDLSYTGPEGATRQPDA